MELVLSFISYIVRISVCLYAFVKCNAIFFLATSSLIRWHYRNPHTDDKKNDGQRRKMAFRPTHSGHSAETAEMSSLVIILTYFLKTKKWRLCAGNDDNSNDQQNDKYL